VRTIGATDWSAETAAGELPVATSRLSKSYRGGVHALRDVDLEIMPGEITGLVGPNGAGKTTLLKILLGFEKPTAGRAAVFGLDPWRHRTESLANVGYVPQGTALYSGLTVADHLALARFNRPTLDIQHAMTRLEDLGISGRSQARKLSGGQQAQLLLTIALATHARLLLLDEPLGSLDPLARREFLGAFREAVGIDGTTVIMTSHIVSDIEEVCTALAVIGNGKVRLHGSISAALEGHLVTDARRDVPDATLVGSFAGPSGQVSALWRLNDADPPDAPPQRSTENRVPPSLNDLVLGYLAGPRGSAERIVS
jgi:ABC-2 type transport system ATP-binding protein